MSGEKARGGGIEQAGIGRAAAVMEKPGDRRDAELPHAAQPLVVPSPVGVLRPVWGNSLPQDRVAQRSDPERRDAVEVVWPGMMAGLDTLVSITVADAGDGAFETTP